MDGRGTTYTATAVSDETSTLVIVSVGETTGILTVTAGLAGTATVAITATDAAGNPSDPLSLPITVNAKALRLAMPDLDTQDDMGREDDDNITNQSSDLTFFGIDAQRNVTVTVTAILVTTATTTTPLTTDADADRSGNYTAELDLSPDGMWVVTASQRVGPDDSIPSLGLTVTVDTDLRGWRVRLIRFP